MIGLISDRFRQSCARNFTVRLIAVPAPRQGTAAAHRIAHSVNRSCNMEIDARTPPQPRTPPDHDGWSPARSPAARLAALIAAYAPHDGMFDLPLRGMRIARACAPPAQWSHGVHHACLSIVGQGAKSMRVGDDTYTIDASRMLVATADLPVTGRVTRANPAEPFLYVQLALDPHRIAALTPRVFPRGLPKAVDCRALATHDATPEIVDAVARLMHLIAQPDDLDLLAPLIVDEILIRLLRGPSGARVAQIGDAGSTTQRISRAVAWIRDHYLDPMAVDSLARQVGMSPSTFHHHFRAVTSMSPLQCQKVLRLQEARHLMCLAAMDARQACRSVGYVSASQFSREYARLFGDAPGRDVARLRGEAVPLSRVIP
ncbi:AraC family transcriptional regulator [Burkholderia anthina]|nr:AraC family transcriptional regulator [Burkholderia anthina]KVH15206.1 AraC family transcriptional regulator [Burkholderia anthina]KVM95282.1 AraC family transcriptional regulator [Burkholderia anthina]KVN65766.1 AraC family transcriptional regulator [Burkholderia anthina]KVX40826.1 AraC family transcriptional regulator [Burkholderia anthina]